MSSAREIKSNLLAISALSVVEKLVSFVLVVAIARYFGASVYGQYAFSVALATFMVLLSDLGLTNFLTRDLAKKPEATRLYLSNALSTKLISSVLSFGLLVLLTQFSTQMREASGIILLVGAGMILRGFATTFYAVVRAYEKMHYELYSGALNRLIIASVGIAVLVISGKLVLALVVIVCASIAECLFIAWLVYQRFAPFDLRFCIGEQKQLLVGSLPFMLMSGLTLIIYRADSVLLNFMKGDTETGLYNSAYALVLNFIFIREVIGRILLPRLSKLGIVRDARFASSYRQVLKLLVVLAFFLVLVLSLYSEQIILLLFGREFLAASSCLRIVAWSLLFMFASYVLNLMLISINRERKLLKAHAYTAGLNLLLNVILIPQHGILGAAVATVASEVTLFLVFCYFVVREGLPLLEWNEWVRLGLPFVTGLTFLLVFGGLSVYLTVPVLSLVYLVALLAVRSFSRAELLSFVRLIRS